MVENLDREQESNDRQFGSWQVITSAWGLVLLFVILLAAASAVACLRSGSPPDRHLARVVIPQHNPCVGAGVPSAPAIDGCQVVPVAQDWSAYW